MARPPEMSKTPAVVKLFSAEASQKAHVGADVSRLALEKLGLSFSLNPTGWEPPE